MDAQVVEDNLARIQRDVESHFVRESRKAADGGWKIDDRS